MYVQGHSTRFGSTKVFLLSKPLDEVQIGDTVKEIAGRKYPDLTKICEAIQVVFPNSRMLQTMTDKAARVTKIYFP